MNALTATRHPAKFSTGVLAAIERILNDNGVVGTIVDPFAGVGGVHTLNTNTRHTVGIELEPEWASQHPQNLVGDALALPFNDGEVDAIITSPSYGNRMADHHEAKDDSKRNTYRHALGRMPSENSSSVMQWGETYRAFHHEAWSEAIRVLREGGDFILNISNHIRKGQEMPVVEWHLGDLILQGLFVRSVTPVQTHRLRYGANWLARVPTEYLIHAVK